MFSSWDFSNSMSELKEGIKCDFCDRVLGVTEYKVAGYTVNKKGDKPFATNFYCSKPCYPVLAKIESGELPCQLDIKGIEKTEYISVRKVHKSNKPKRGGKRD